MSRQHTTEEVRQAVIEHIHGIVRYWDGLPDKTQHERLDGVAFSILVMFDGGSLSLPAFQIIASPHPDDKEYMKSEGRDYFADVPENEQDIGGALHEFYSMSRKVEMSEKPATIKASEWPTIADAVARGECEARFVYDTTNSILVREKPEKLWFDYETRSSSHPTLWEIVEQGVIQLRDNDLIALTWKQPVLSVSVDALLAVFEDVLNNNEISDAHEVEVALAVLHNRIAIDDYDISQHISSEVGSLFDNEGLFVEITPSTVLVDRMVKEIKGLREKIATLETERDAFAETLFPFAKIFEDYKADCEQGYKRSFSRWFYDGTIFGDSEAFQTAFETYIALRKKQS